MSNGRSQNSSTGLSDLQITVSCTLSVSLKLHSPSESIPRAQEERGELMSKKHFQNLRGLGVSSFSMALDGGGAYVTIIKVILAQILNSTTDC